MSGSGKTCVQFWVAISEDRATISQSRGCDA
jgi:hypothetical protein